MADQEIYEKSIVYFNSNNRSSGTHYDGKMTIHNHLEKVVKMGVKSIKMYNSFYNITALNDTFSFTENITPHVGLAIARGNYTLTEILNYIKVVINSVCADVWSWTFSVNSGLITWTSVGATTGFFTIDSQTSEGVVYGLMTDLGFTTQATATHPIQSNQIPDVDISEVLVEVKGLNNTHTHNKYLKSVLTTVPISTVGFGSMYAIENSSIYFHDISKSGTSIHEITYSLRDTNHNILNNNGVPWSMELVCLHK